MRIYLCLLLCYLSTGRCEDESCPEFECPDQTGSFADPCTCRRYYQCVDFTAHRSFCPSGLYWDDVRKYCTYKDEAVCGPVTTTPAPITTESPDKANKCDPNLCELPYCFCSEDGTKIPNNLKKEEIPQIVMLMLDGAVNQNNFDDYKDLFRGRKNPDGCRIKGTFFLTHHYSNYQQIMSLKHDGHEMAVSSITEDTDLYLKNATAWKNELEGMKSIMELQADISPSEVFGARAPGLTPGYNAQFEAMLDQCFIWDSSVAAPPLNPPVWPYTLDYEIPHKCKSGTCPTRQFPGIWEIPMNSHHVEDFAGGHCPYLDQCVFSHMDTDDVFEWLKEDFLRYYSTNKAPYNLAMKTNWFTTKTQREALHKFIDWTQTMDDVYYVTATQALLWMLEPATLSEMKSGFEPWSCSHEQVSPRPCETPRSCALPHKQNNVSVVKYMTTCKSCPAVYPWLGNSRGRLTEELDDYPSECQ